jgi:hypothetical protein
MHGHFTGIFSPILVAILVALSFSCGGETDPKVKKIGLKSIEIRDSKVGSGENEEEEEEGGGDDGSESKDPKDSVTAFGLELHPHLKQYCGECHGKNQPPLFAQDNKKLAHDVILESNKVDFKHVENSRIVQRVASDRHQCKDEDCTIAAKAFTEGINGWVAKINAEEEGPVLPLTTNLKFTDANDGILKADNPPGVIYLEAETGTVKAPMVAVAAPNAIKGSYIHTPVGAINQNNAVTAATQETLGTLTFQIDVKVAGAYQVFGRVGSPIATTNSFYIKADNGALQTWQFPQTNDDLIWDKADPVVATGTPISFNLTAGPHTFEVRQRRGRARIDALILTNDPLISPDNVSTGDEAIKRISYDIGDISGVPGAKLHVFVADYSANAYVFRNPTIELPGGAKVKVKNMKLLINGRYLPQHATYTVIDTEAAGPENILSTSALVALKDKGNADDEFSFEFEVLTKIP